MGDVVITKTVNILVDCDLATLTEPTEPLVFGIIPPPPIGDGSTIVHTYYDKVLYWSTHAATYDLNVQFTTSYPTSCPIQIQLEVKDPSTSTFGPNPYPFLSLVTQDYPASP